MKRIGYMVFLLVPPNVAGKLANGRRHGNRNADATEKAQRVARTIDARISIHADEWICSGTVTGLVGGPL